MRVWIYDSDGVIVDTWVIGYEITRLKFDITQQHTPIPPNGRMEIEVLADG